QQMGQRVLNGSAALRPVAVIDFPVGGTIRGKVLPGDGDELQWPAEPLLGEHLSKSAEQAIAAIHVGDSHAHIVLSGFAAKLVNAVEARTEWLFDKDMYAGSDELSRERHVEGRRGCDDGELGPPIERVLESRVRCHLVLL